MKPETKQFNFNLPEDLKNYLNYRSSSENSSISQYLIDLINGDKKANPIDPTKINLKKLDAASLSNVVDIILSTPWLIVCLNESSHDIFHEKHQRTKNKYSVVFDILKKVDFNPSTDTIICHPSFKDAIVGFIAPSYSVITLDKEQLRSRVVIVSSKSVETHSFVREDATEFIDEQMLQEFTILSFDKKQPEFQIVEQTLNNGTHRYYAKNTEEPDKKFVFRADKKYFDVLNEVIYEVKMHQRFGDMIKNESLRDKVKKFDTYETSMIPPSVRNKAVETRVRHDNRPVSPEYIIPVMEFATSYPLYEAEQVESLFDPGVQAETTYRMDDEKIKQISDRHVLRGKATSRIEGLFSNVIFENALKDLE